LKVFVMNINGILMHHPGLIMILSFRVFGLGLLTK
jgi:hypothetical protein